MATPSKTRRIWSSPNSRSARRVADGGAATAPISREDTDGAGVEEAAMLQAGGRGTDQCGQDASEKNNYKIRRWKNKSM